MSQHIVAIDCDARGARIAVIEASMRRATLADVIHVQFAAQDSDEAKHSAIRAALPAGGESLIVGIDAAHTSVRRLGFPFTDPRKVAAAVDFELESQIPFALPDVAQAWSVVGREAHAVQVLAAITPRAPLAAQLAALSRGGIEPRAMVLPAAALAEFLPSDAAQQTGILSMGAHYSHLAVGRSGLQFARTLQFGGNHIDRGVAKALQLEVAQAQSMRHEQVKLPPSAAPTALEAAVLAGFAALVSDLLATFKALPPAMAPTRLLLTGGLSRQRGLTEYLAQNLGISVSLLDVRAATDRFSRSWQTAKQTAAHGAPPPPAHQGGPEDALALGMAIALFRHGHEVALNFRRGPLAYHGDLQLYRGALTRVAVGLAAVCTMAILASVVHFSVLQRQEKEINAAFCGATKRIVGREICDPTAALSTLRQAPGAAGTTIPSYSASTLFEMLCKNIGTDVDVQFDELDLRVDGNTNQPERLLGKGEAANFESTDKLIATLKRDACVRDAEVSKLQRTQNGRASFNLQVKVVCPAGVQPGSKVAALAATPAPSAASPVPAAGPEHRGPPP